jgi:hypothetical protein
MTCGARNDSGYIFVLKLLQSWIKELPTVATEKEANVNSSKKQISLKKNLLMVSCKLFLRRSLVDRYILEM